jgi:hypothetical protein
MLSNLIPAGAIVGLCLAIYATSLNVPPSQLPLTVAPVVPERRPLMMRVEWVKPAAPSPAASQTVVPVVPMPPSEAVPVDQVKPASPPPVASQTVVPVVPMPPSAKIPVDRVKPVPPPPVASLTVVPVVPVPPSATTPVDRVHPVAPPLVASQTVVPVVPVPPSATMPVVRVKPAAPLSAASETKSCGDCAQQKEALAVTAGPTAAQSIEHARGSKSEYPALQPLPKIVHTSPARQQRLPEQYSAHRSTEEPASVRQQLRSAQAALAEGNPELARGLLESAETAMVFEASGSQQPHTASATAQITQALRGLNSGDRAVALQYVGRALAAVGSGL